MPKHGHFRQVCGGTKLRSLETGLAVFVLLQPPPMGDTENPHADAFLPEGILHNTSNTARVSKTTFCVFIEDLCVAQ